MTREEAIARFKGIKDSMSISVAQSKFYKSKAELNELCDMAISALTEAENGCDGCLYEVSDGSLFPCNICRLNYGCMYEKDDSNNITESPNDAIETDDEAIEQNALMSHEEAWAEIESDLIRRADALEKMAQAECGLHYADCEADNCSCSYIGRILDLPSVPAVSLEKAEEITKRIYIETLEKVSKECKECKERLRSVSAERVGEWIHTTLCGDCVHYNDEQTSAVCHDCARSYKDRYESCGAKRCEDERRYGMSRKEPTPNNITESSNDADENDDEVIGKKIIVHNKDWIIGCIKHDGFIKTDRFDKANQIILDALEPSGDLISRADAINALSKDIMGGLNYNRILKELPSAVADGEDLIIKGAKGIKDGLYNIKDGELFKYKSKGGTVRTYPIVPSDDRPSGKWIHEETGWYGGDGYKCSACGYGYSAKAYHEPYEFTYCPNCGAKMGERENVGTDCTDFIHWISKVVADEELWELNAVGYGEIICRKLVKVGALATTEKPPYYYVPSVSAERSGEWIYNNKIGTFKIFTCSLCGVNMETDQWNYCPNCGARMESAK